MNQGIPMINQSGSSGAMIIVVIIIFIAILVITSLGIGGFIYHNNEIKKIPIIEVGNVIKGYWNTGHKFESENGGREDLIDVKFTNKNFVKDDKRPIKVVVSTNYIDAATSANIRILPEATNITEKGFTMKISTWDNSKIYGLGLSYVATQ